MHGSVTLHMTASTRTVWDLVSDITNTGRFSPETFEAQWLDGATGPGVGVRFRGHVRRNGRGPVYWTKCTIIRCEPECDFAFTVDVGDKPVNTWRYQLEQRDGGTDVTESFELTANALTRVYWALLGWARSKTNIKGMQATLERIRKEAEAVDRS